MNAVRGFEGLSAYIDQTVVRDGVDLGNVGEGSSKVPDLSIRTADDVMKDVEKVLTL